MKTKNPKQQIQSTLQDIIKLYKNEKLIIMFNDFVAIGTWPTPEKPKIVIKRNTDGSIAIDSVPLPERPKYLHVLVNEIIENMGEANVGKMFGSTKHSI